MVHLEVPEDEQEQPLALPSLLGIQDCLVEIQGCSVGNLGCQVWDTAGSVPVLSQPCFHDHEARLGMKARWEN